MNISLALQNAGERRLTHPIVAVQRAKRNVAPWDKTLAEMIALEADREELRELLLRCDKAELLKLLGGRHAFGAGLFDPEAGLTLNIGPDSSGSLKRSTVSPQ